MKRNVWVGLLLAALVIVLAACGQAGSTPTIEPVTYSVDMKEFAFQPSDLQARIGQQVTIELTNSGALEHEFMVGRNVMMNNNRPDGFEQELFAGTKPAVTGGQMTRTEDSGHGDAHTGFMVVLPPWDEKATITFTVTEDMAGEWEIGCFSQQGVHYDAGMKGKFIVTE